MFYFGKTSKRRLSECDDDLQRLMLEAITDKKCPFDFLIVCGYRGEKEQNWSFDNGFSQLRFPDGNHNQKPSKAVDVARYYPSNPHIRWDNEEDFEALTRHIKKIAKRLKIDIVCGIDWETFKDGPHIELKVKEATK